MDMMGVIWSNFRIREVAETPSSLGITISYTHPMRSRVFGDSWRKKH
jgi:hypothetical protein